MADKKRFIGKLCSADMLPKDEEGHNLCRVCSNPVLPPRRTMCSKECAHELKLRTNGRYLRRCVYKRDKGICKMCGEDTTVIAKKALRLKLDGLTEKLETLLKENNISLKRKIWAKKFGGGLWDADHIIPVKDGGGQCGLDNIRTLCIDCHKAVTKKGAQKNRILK
jgi:5-methylcytosine-specific restriction endonuclease McrA